MTSPEASGPEAIQFKNYFQTADVVILAESEHGRYTEEISAFIDQFKDQLSGLLVEWSLDMQASIDKYIESGEVDADLLRSFVNGLKENKDLRSETLAIFDKAKECGVPVICFDALKERPNDPEMKIKKKGSWFIQGECRDEDMYTNVVNYYQNHPGKYVVVVGTQHLADRNFEGDNISFGPRIKSYLGDKCVAVKMSDSVEREPIYNDILVKAQ